MTVSATGSRARPGRRSKREAVLDAALALFTERTYGGTAMPLVAERAAIGVGTIYRYFPSKEALGNAVFQRWKREMLSYLTRGATDGEPAAATFQRMWRGMAAFAADHPAAFAFLEHQQHAAYLDEASQALTAEVEAVATAVIEAGQRAGVIRPAEPALLIALVFGAFVGLTKLARDGDTPLTGHDLATAERAVWDLLTGKDTA